MLWSQVARRFHVASCESGFAHEMASKDTSMVKVQTQKRGLTATLKSAACEWLLIGLMLCNALISYFLTKFARYSGLTEPCILCSRLDHVLGNERPGFYRNLLCGKHRSEVSAMVACHIHGKLADGNGMCEECLFSFVLSTKADGNTYRPLLGNFGYDPGTRTPQCSLFNSEYSPAAVGTRLCSCCKKPWISRQCTHKLFQVKSPRPDIPLPRRLNHRGNIRKIRDRVSISGGPHGHLKKIEYDPMSHIGYSELKRNSDSESDFPYSDDDDDLINNVHPINQGNEGSYNEAHDESSKLGLRPGPGASGVVQCSIPYLETIVTLGEHDSKQTDTKKATALAPELISLDDFTSSNVADSSVEESSTRATSKRPYPSAISELMSLVESPSLFHIPRSLVEASQKKDENGILDFKSTSTSKHEEILKSLNTKVEAGIRGDKLAKEVTPSNSAYTPFTNTQKPDARVEDIDKPSTKNEDVRSQPIEDVSPKDPELFQAQLQEMDGSCDDKQQTIGPSSVTESHAQPQEGSAAETTKSVDESSLSEVEAGSSIEQLKQRIEQDGNPISSLTAELEEERNASAIAANQAMAMITRLQEEKASLHMEALQYLRMMEEQAEYDVEALEKANDLLAEREKEIQDLEAELDFLRLRLSESTSDVAPTGDSVLGEDAISSNPMPNEDSARIEKGSETSWPDFEDEKSFISKSLKELESRLRQFTSHPPSPSLSDNGHHTENDDQVVRKKSNHLEADGKASAVESNGVDLVNIENELTDLNDRLEALESNWYFLDHTINCLQSGKDGIKFIQHIAHQLQELRKIGHRGCPSITMS